MNDFNAQKLLQKYPSTHLYFSNRYKFVCMLHRRRHWGLSFVSWGGGGWHNAAPPPPPPPPLRAYTRGILHLLSKSSLQWEDNYLANTELKCVMFCFKENILYAPIYASILSSLAHHCHNITSIHIEHLQTSLILLCPFLHHICLLQECGILPNGTYIFLTVKMSLPCHLLP